MKKAFITLLVVAITFLVVFNYRKTTDYEDPTNTLIIGTSADFPPLSFKDNNNTITGFDIDVAKEVARRLGKDIDIQDMPFSDLLPKLQSGQLHIVAAGISPTVERAQTATFTKPYLTGNPLLVISLSKNPPVTSLEDLKGKTVIVNTGHIADLYMSKFPDITVMRLAKVADAIEALDQNKGYAFVASSFSIKPYIKNQDKNKYSLLRLTEPDEDMALAISKTLPQEFVKLVQKALDDMESDGTLAALKNKWDLV